MHCPEYMRVLHQGHSRRNVPSTGGMDLPGLTLNPNPPGGAAMHPAAAAAAAAVKAGCECSKLTQAFTGWAASPITGAGQLAASQQQQQHT
jgi:hypothetical protein